MKQTFSIFRTETVNRRQADGTLVPGTLVSHYPGFGAQALTALDTVMEEIAENECDELEDIPADDPDYDHVLMQATENLPGRWEAFAGVHVTRPDTAPAACYGDAA